MKAIINFLIISIFFLLPPLLMSEENTKQEKITGRDTWRFINHLDKEEYFAQQKALNNTNLAGWRSNKSKIDIFRKIVKIFQIEGDNKNTLPTKQSLHCFTIDENGILGYRNRHFNIFLLDTYSDISVFTIDSKPWSEKLNLSSKIDNSEGEIRIAIRLCKNGEIARTSLIEDILSGSMPPHAYLTLYKIDKGPGDVCLVKVDGGGTFLPVSKEMPLNPMLSDQRVAFVRGNVAVYLSSYYNNFGCMDLACRLDALIVEQMKKQQEEDKKKGQPSE